MLHVSMLKYGYRKDNTIAEISILLIKISKILSIVYGIYINKKTQACLTDIENFLPVNKIARKSVINLSFFTVFLSLIFSARKEGNPPGVYKLSNTNIQIIPIICVMI